MILDGWGIAKNKAVSADQSSKHPLSIRYTLVLPIVRWKRQGCSSLTKRAMGNSEVGHMNLWREGSFTIPGSY